MDSKPQLPNLGIAERSIKSSLKKKKKLSLLQKKPFMFKRRLEY